MKPSLPLCAIAAALCLLSLDAPVLAAAAAAPAAKAAANAPVTRRHELQTNIVDGKMVFVDTKGQVNPVLTANTGDTIELEIGRASCRERVF